MPRILTKSTLVQVMAWCRQAPSHYLSQCWPRSMSSYGIITGPMRRPCLVQKRPKIQQFISFPFSTAMFSFRKSSPFISESSQDGCSSSQPSNRMRSPPLPSCMSSSTFPPLPAPPPGGFGSHVTGRSEVNSVEDWITWPPYCKWHFEMDFCEWKLF